MKHEKSFVARVRKIPLDGWIMIGVAAVVTIFGMVLTVALCLSLASGDTMFGASESEGGNLFDIVMLVVFALFTLAMIALLIYNLFFRHFERIEPVTKEIVNGHVVELKSGHDEHFRDVIKTDPSKDSVIDFDVDKIKASLKKTPDKEEEKNTADSPDSEKEDS